MIIMALAHAQSTGNATLLSNHVFETFSFRNKTPDAKSLPSSRFSANGETIWSIIHCPRVRSTSDALSCARPELTVNRTTSSSDGINAMNQTNLALKGIIAVGAMSKISQAVGSSDDQERYNVRSYLLNHAVQLLMVL